MSVEIREIELRLDDVVSEAWLEVHHAAARAVWGPDAHLATVAELLDIPPRRGEVRRTFGVWGDGDAPDAPRASAQTIRRTRENTDTGGVFLSVHPDHQRQGLGSLLLAHCEQVLREEGVARIHEHAGSPQETGDAASAFARRQGYRQTQVTFRQDLVLPVADDALDALDPGLDPEAYVVETSVDGLPEEWLEDRALLARRMSTDAPMGDVDLDEEEWDADRVRQLWNTPSPVWAVETVARHVPSGRLVGFTDLVVRPGAPDLAVQSDTLVLREHRGHALGLAMKLANLRALQREKPHVDRVRTWNADTNTPMLAVNRRMGFEVVGWSREWLKEL